jgi:hypothetical protein
LRNKNAASKAEMGCDSVESMVSQEG